MEISVKEVSHRRELKEFIFLPEKIHAAHENWVHPIYLDEWQYFNPKKNRAFSYCDTILLLAYQGGRPVGRVMGIVNHRHNKIKKEKTARFACLETYQDTDIVHALLSHIETWAIDREINRIIGPYGFSDLDPEGFMIEGFENRATISTYYNFEWMPGFVEAYGYKKEVDYVTYKIEIPEEIPDLLMKMYNRIQRRGSLESVTVRNKADIKTWIKQAFQIMNESYLKSDIFGFTPLDEKEIDALVHRYISIVDSKFIRGVKRDNELIGFVIALPDMTRGIQQARGRLFPFGLFKILRGRKNADQLDLLLGAIKEKYRGLGADLLMMIDMGIAAQKAGIEIVDTHHQMETNKKMRAVSEMMGGKVYKRHRVYQKQLQPLL